MPKEPTITSRRVKREPILEQESPTTILLVRHGATDYPTEDCFYDSIKEPSLNQTGVDQAKALAKWAQGEPIKALYVSSSERAVATAEPVARVLELEMQILAELKERNFGLWEGLTYQSVAQQYPEDWQSWQVDPVNFVPPGGESLENLNGRVNKVIREILLSYKGKTVMVISHAGPIRAILVEILKMDKASYRQLVILPGSVTRLECGDDFANVNVVCMGCNPACFFS